jgi:autotransporter-associated beta strand protein
MSCQPRASTGANPSSSAAFRARRAGWVRRASLLAIGLALAAGLGIEPASAQSTWNVQTGTWSTADSWLSGVPATTGTAVFSSGSVTGDVTALLSTSTTIGRLTFNGTNAVTLQSDSATAQTLRIGTGGIVLSATSGPVTIGTSGSMVNILLGGAQTWTTSTSASGTSGLLSILGTIDNASGSNLLTISPTISTISISGNILNSTGTISLTKSGNGTLVLTGSNSYSGTTTLSAGTLVVGNNSALSTGTFTVSSATLQAAGSARTLANPTILNGSPTVSGSNSLTFAGPFTNSGGNRTLTNSITGGSLEISGTTFLQENGTGVGRTFTLAGAGSTLFSGPIVNGGTAGNSSLTINNGTVTLAGSNSYTGTTTLGGGTLAISSDANISGTASALTFNGGTLQILGTSLTSLNPNRTTTFSATKTVGFNIAGAANTFTVGQNLNQTTGGLTKTGSGTLLLTGTNTYTGLTSVNAGTLRLQGGSAIADSGTVSMGGGSLLLDASETIGQLNVTAGGSLSSNSGATLTSTGGVAVSAANSTIDFNVPLGGGPFSITGASNTITLSAGNTFTSGSLANGSSNTTLILGNASALGSGSFAFGPVGGSSGPNLTMRATTPLTIDTMLYMAGKFPIITVDGSNSLTFNNYASWGSDVGATSAQNVTFVNNLAAGGVLAFRSVVTDPTGTTSSRSFTVSGSGNTNFGNLIVGSLGDGVLTVNSTGTTTISGTLSAAKSSGYVLNAGRLVISGGGVIVAGGTQTAVSTITGSTGAVFEYASSANSTLVNVTGGVALVKTNSGTLTLGGNSATQTTGGVTLDGGALVFLPTFSINPLGTGTFTIKSGAFDNGTTLTSITTTPQAWNGDFTFLGTNNLNMGTGAVTLGTSPTVTVNSSTLTIGGAIGDGGFGRGVTKSGAGTLSLSGTNTFTGLTQPLEGSLVVAGTFALQNSTLDMSASGSGSVVFNQNSTLGGLTGSRNLDLNNRQITVGNNNGSTTYSGVLSSGTLVKTGTGSLVLSNANTFTGPTTVSAGSLLVNGSLANGAVTVQSGALLGGSGVLGGAIGGAGVIAPGNSPGILTAPSLSFVGGLDFAFEFGQAGAPTWSSAVASGNDVLRLTNSSSPLNTATAANVFDIYFLEIGQNYLGGIFTDRTSSFETAIAGATFNYYVRDNAGAITYGGFQYAPLSAGQVTRSTVQVGSADFSGGTVSNGYAMQFVVVPEPGAIALAVIGIATAAYAFRRRT